MIIKIFLEILKFLNMPEISETKDRINSNYNKEDLKYIQEYKYS